MPGDGLLDVLTGGRPPGAPECDHRVEFCSVPKSAKSRGFRVIQYVIAGLVLGGIYAIVSAGLVVTYLCSGGSCSRRRACANADAPVDVLPLGTARLVEVGRALATAPSVVLLDEPSAGLDAREGDALAEALRRTVRDERISMLLVEHDVAMVLSLTSYVFVLDFGALLAQGTPEFIRNDPQVKAAHLGSGPEAAALLPDQFGTAEGVASPR